jgi:hypothetical protein
LQRIGQQLASRIPTISSLVHVLRSAGIVVPKRSDRVLPLLYGFEEFIADLISHERRNGLTASSPASTQRNVQLYDRERFLLLSLSQE